MYRVAIRRHDGSIMFLRVDGTVAAWVRNPQDAMKIKEHDRAQKLAERRGGYVFWE